MKPTPMLSHRALEMSRGCRRPYGALAARAGVARVHPTFDHRGHAGPIEGLKRLPYFEVSPKWRAGAG